MNVYRGGGDGGHDFYVEGRNVRQRLVDKAIFMTGRCTVVLIKLHAPHKK